MFSGASLAAGCYLRPGLVLRDLPQRRRIVDTRDAAESPTSAASKSGTVEFDYEITGELRLDDGFVPRGLGSCDDVTHVSALVEVGDRIRILGDGRLVERESAGRMPFRAVVEPVRIEPDDVSKLRSHAEPMVYIEGGDWDGESVAPFWLDRWEVGIAAYRECVDGGYCDRPACDDVDECDEVYHPYNDERAEENYPVFFVPWRAADIYCAWAGKRVPTLREWQWAARGREEARTYPWGEAPVDCERANGGESGDVDEDTPCSDATVATRGNRPLGVSRDGVENLADNVEEWVVVTKNSRSPWPWTSAGSSVLDHFDETDSGEFTVRAQRQEYRPSSGIRCAADEPPPDALARSRPHISRVDDLNLHVHDNQGLRTRSDARAYCDAFDGLDSGGWRLPSKTLLAKLEKRVVLAKVPYWTNEAAGEGGKRRTLCVKNP